MMSRLALALLALAGFAAPAAQRELDGVVQTSRAPRAVESSAPATAVIESEVVVEVQALPAPSPSAPRAHAASPFIGSSARRYLLHRAWLL
jgi:hypothetical protein